MSDIPVHGRPQTQSPVQNNQMGDETRGQNATSAMEDAGLLLQLDDWELPHPPAKVLGSSVQRWSNSCVTVRG